MNLAYLEVAGFRGVQRTLRLNLPSGFAVITGRNGSGKSSVCDAIEYALTGHVRGSEAAKEKGETWEDYLFIRDDTIGELSLDLSETERFAFVKGAVGTTNLIEFEKRLVELARILQVRQKAAEQLYAGLRGKVAVQAVTLSEAKAQATRAEGTREAEGALRELTELPAAPLVQVIARAREIVARSAVEIRGVEELAREWTTLLQRKAAVAGDAFRARQAAIRDSLEKAENELNRVTAEVAPVEQALARLQAEQPLLASLAELHQHGSRVGLRDGRCPLCGSEIAADRYGAHLETLKRAVDAKVGELRAVVARRAELRTRQTQLVQAVERLRGEELEVAAAAEALGERERALLVKTRSVLGDHTATGDQAAFTRAVEARRNATAAIERVLVVAEASRLMERVSGRERELASASREADAAQNELQRAEAASEKATKALAAVRRTAGEIVDERLAALSPLLRELYSRLRPHVDWQEVDYHIRGDLRRFLSLRVGENLNPRFMFSSGQRRAAGLAFLLSVHLARSWVKLRTLVLDDPIQHVDDFRALHFVEVLSAIRKSGRQVVCAVEDEALADLLCRRLRSRDGEEGVKITLEYKMGRGIEVVAEEKLAPYSSDVLASAG